MVVLDVWTTVTSDDVRGWLQALATVCAVIVALFAPGLHRRIFGPRLRIEYEPGPPFDRLTAFNAGGRVTVAFWTRLRIHNVGRSTAHKCQVRVLAIRDHTGAPRDDRDPMLLRWSAMTTTTELEPLDLHRGGDQLVALCYTHPYMGHLQIATDESIAAGFDTFLEPSRTHLVLVGASCEETNSRVLLEVQTDNQGSAQITVRSR